MPSELKSQIQAAVKDAMRARDKQRLGVLRLIMSEIKRIEVDERIEVEDDRLLAILDKMTKQRKDSLQQFQAADRQDLADQESFEIGVIQEYLPKALEETEIENIIDAAITTTGASSMKDMGALMAEVRPQLQGRADMGFVSQVVKKKLQ